MRSVNKQARLAGLLYLLVALIAPIGMLYVPGKLVVRGDATATADNIRASESLFRIGVASELAGAILMIFVVLALFRLFEAVDRNLAGLMVVLGALVSIPLSLLNAVNHLAALVLVSGPDFLTVFEQGKLDALAYFFLRLHHRTVVVAEIFWGLWLFPFGLLALRSGFIPRFLGYLLFVAGVGYVVDSAAWLLLPQQAGAIGRVTFVLIFAELPIIFWLLIWGARERPPTAPAG